MRLTKSLQEKLEKILSDSGYQVRYEKGNFKGGFCILDHQKVIVVNQFFPFEGKVNTLIDVLSSIEIDEKLLTPEQQKLFYSLKQMELKFSS